METTWFCLLAFMLVMYVVLDGFDLGAGIIHLFVARNDAERRMVLNAIGPVWDGNEVWLLAAGGTLYFAFPAVYAAAFSGFYLPLIIILWLLMLRGLGIEFRHQLEHPVWKTFWDGVFFLGSTLLAIFFGAALGNIIRGVPLNREGSFFEPLWTTFSPFQGGGILDWFTVTLAVVSFCTLTVHGANYIAMKTEGDVQSRARKSARNALMGTVLFSVLALAGTIAVRPGVFDNYAQHPWGWIFPLCALVALAGMVHYNRKGGDARAFFSSAFFIAAMLLSTAFGLFPDLLPSSIDPSFSLTAYTSASGSYALGIGIIWWSAGMLLALGYFAYLFRSFHGKVGHTEAGEGY